jgi:glycosyltransferase involved in cell wall biosynthesis
MDILPCRVVYLDERMQILNRGRDIHSNSLQSDPLHMETKFHMLSRKNIQRFFKIWHTHGFRAAIQAIVRKLHKSNVILTPTIIPLSIPKISAKDPEENLPVIDKKVTVVIPTRNAGKDFPYFLKKLKHQKGLREIETVIVDSGSTDGTLEIARNEKVRVIEISPEDFNHGYSRNKGAEHAEGDYVLFLVQDALPLTDRWLWELAMALEENDLAAVSCAEYPRSDCNLFYQWIIWNHYQTLNLDKDRILGWDESCGTYLGLRSNSQINSVATLIKKDIFTRYKFRKKYAEDLDLGIRLIQGGHRIGFLYSTRILHSHNRPAYYFLKRSYVDTMFLKDVFTDFPVPEIENPERLFGDIAAMYARTKQAASYLKTIKSGETQKAGDLMDRVAGMYSEGSDGMESTDTLPDNKDLDNFIQKLGTYTKERSILYKHNENCLLPSLLDNLKSLQTYVSQSREFVDGFLAEELASALYKMLALNSGACIAYWQLSSKDRAVEEQLQVDLDQELSADI